MSHRGFIVFGLPRSRTFWLSRFLTYRDWTCGHDEARHLRTMADVKAWFSQPCTGTVETAAAPFWRLVPEGIRVAVVRRPVDDVLASLVSLGLHGDLDGAARYIRYLDRKLDQIERRVPGILAVSFDDLAREDACGALFQHCTGERHDHAWWECLAPVNLQVNMLALMRYMQAYRKPMEGLAAIARQETISAMARDDAPIDGVTIQEESFDASFPDAQALFREHSIQSGETPDFGDRINVGLFRELDATKWLQIMTARSNGKMFGYLVSVVGPCLETPGVLTAEHTVFFASPAIPRLGMKLQRGAIAALEAKGVRRLFLRAGVRAMGPRMDLVYRRLGAHERGTMFTLELNGA